MTHDSPEGQLDLFDGDLSPAAAWDKDAAQRALDALFFHTQHYDSGDAYRKLMRFIVRFRFYSPFNAMLIYTQMPGATYVAPAHRWQREYARRVKPDARPLVILQPRGPVMFVFDVSDTVPEEGAPVLPVPVTNPFVVSGDIARSVVDQTIGNAVRDGVEVIRRKEGSQSAGAIRVAESSRMLGFRVSVRPKEKIVPVACRYELFLNQEHTAATQYATLVHELAHLYCGHIGTRNPAWWPDRRGLPTPIREFEAESVSHLVCARAGIDTESERYLAEYLPEGKAVPPISLDCVVKVAGLIESMGRENLGLRKDSP